MVRCLLPRSSGALCFIFSRFSGALVVPWSNGTPCLLSGSIGTVCCQGLKVLCLLAGSSDVIYLLSGYRGAMCLLPCSSIAICLLPCYSSALSLLRYTLAQYLCCHVTVARYLCCQVTVAQYLCYHVTVARYLCCQVTVAQYLCCQVTVAQYICCQVHVLFRLPRDLHDVHQSPWQPLHQLLPHGSDGTASRNSPVSFGGQVSEPGNCWQTTAGKRWSCWQRTGWWVSSGRVQPDGDNNNGYLDHCRLIVQLLARELELENFIFQGLYFSITQNLSNSVVLAKVIMIICLQGIIYIRIWSVDEWVKIYTRGKTTSTQTLACSQRQMHTEYTCIQCIHHSVIHVYKHSASRSTDRTSKTFI